MKSAVSAGKKEDAKMAKDSRKETIKLGDTVEGTHFGVAFRGTVTGWSDSWEGPFVDVKPEGTFELYGTVRDVISTQETRTWTVVARRIVKPEIRQNQYGECSLA